MCDVTMTVYAVVACYNGLQEAVLVLFVDLWPEVEIA